jgi:hypothetical protein
VWVLPLAALIRRPALPLVAMAVTVVLLAMQIDHYELTRHSHHRPHHHHHQVLALLRVSG